MSLLLDSNDASRRGKRWEHLAERGADGREIAVQQHQRLARAIDLVVHLEAVHRNIAALHRRARFMLRCHECSLPCLLSRCPFRLDTCRWTWAALTGDPSTTRLPFPIRHATEHRPPRIPAMRSS